MTALLAQDHSDGVHVASAASAEASESGSGRELIVVLCSARLPAGTEFPLCAALNQNGQGVYLLPVLALNGAYLSRAPPPTIFSSTSALDTLCRRVGDAIVSA